MDAEALQAFELQAQQDDKLYTEKALALTTMTTTLAMTTAELIRTSSLTPFK